MAFQYELADFIDFRDREECERVRNISKEELTEHENDEFRIRIIEEPEDFYFEFALDIVRRVMEANREDRDLVGIFPVGPVPQYPLAARMINELKVSCDNLHIFAMDEYADQDGNTAPVSWPGSFQKTMQNSFIRQIDENLRPPLDQVHFPTTDVIDAYPSMMENLGGVDICYGGIGWCGHIAFWESHLWEEFGDDIEAYKQAGPRTVELQPMTIMQNALHSFHGDWSHVPPKANTIGPGQITEADYRSFWLDGTIGGGLSWQRFIARLVAHGPVSTKVPGSILQTLPGTFTILGGVAEDIEVEMH
ncbi:MAG: hypothetical protein V5A87_06785 [Candidatus Bipolaricaulota bacterium]|nr:hypothetical protein [Candidatus Bipolaricaulota bacterium]MBS3791575.1 hypothetical protein [Candidatus Bipolaricaulota bacterium]